MGLLWTGKVAMTGVTPATACPTELPPGTPDPWHDYFYNRPPTHYPGKVRAEYVQGVLLNSSCSGEVERPVRTRRRSLAYIFEYI